MEILIFDINISYVSDWLANVFCDNNVFGAIERALVASICWEIWKSRCNWVFDRERVNVEKVIMNASRIVNKCKMLKSHSKLKRQVIHIEAVDRSLYWRRPLPGGVKINVDGSFNSVLKSSGIGLVCIDEFGNFLGGCGKNIVVESAIKAKYLVVLEGLRVAQCYPDQKVFVEMDCEILF